MERLDPLACLDLLLPKSDHLQIAGYPGRHEPNIGNLNLARVLDLVNSHSYTGWVGCEYQPAIGTLEGISWRDRVTCLMLGAGLGFSTSTTTKRSCV